MSQASKATSDDLAHSPSQLSSLAVFFPPMDPLFSEQWYLHSSPAGINTLPAWTDYTGKGIRVAVFDQGIDYFHSDLDGNYSFEKSFNTVTGGIGGAPLIEADKHGTAVAGLIAAERNDIGIVGVAYNATLFSYYNPLSASSASFAQQSTRAFTHALQADIVNNSWSFGNYFISNANSAFIDDFGSLAFQYTGNAVARLASEGRNGLGTVIVQASGNTGEYGDNTNLHSFQNDRHIIVVAGTDRSGSVADYSVSGASLLISAPSGDTDSAAAGILTTDRTGTNGYTNSDYTTLAGTSFSAPLISGVVALMMEANENLGWRDIQNILTLSARNTGTIGQWQFNHSNNWNGGGRQFSENYGFGLVDATAAVRLAETWSTTNTSANENIVSTTLHAFAEIPDNRMGGVSQSVILNALDVEWVTVTVKLTHDWIGDLSIALTSPSGTTATLLNSPGVGRLTRWGSSQDDIDFTFSAANFRGEPAAGEWRLTVIDDTNGDTGSINSWTISVYGGAPSPDDTYFYTDEFGSLTDQISKRLTLIDADGGVDTLNAAAVTTNSFIDLSGGSSTIRGRSLAVEAGVIEVAICGVGDDTLVGGFADNGLHGGRGNDLIDGGLGWDTAEFSGFREDYLIVRRAGGELDVFGPEGSDTLHDIEVVDFAGEEFPTSALLRPEGNLPDADADGISDILLENGQERALWFVEGTTFLRGGQIGALGPGWETAGMGDFNGDGNSDLLLRNESSLGGWLLNGTQQVGGGLIGTLGLGWRLADAGDFDGDGRDDLLLLHTSNMLAIWRMNGLDMAAGANVATLSPGWSPAGTGDFDADGRDDVLLHNADTHELAIWRMHGMSLFGGGVVGKLGDGWLPMATADFDGDGSADILLQNDTWLAVWLVDDGQLSSGASIGAMADGWSLVGTGDFTGEGRADILLHNGPTLAQWQIDATTVTGGGILNAQLSSNWVPWA